jgi:hypothetical protein
MVEQNLSLALKIASNRGYVVPKRQGGTTRHFQNACWRTRRSEVRISVKGKYVNRKELWEGRIRVKK